MLDPFSHFRLQYFGAWGAGAVFLGLAGRRRWCWGCGGAALVLGVMMVRFYVPGPSGDGGDVLKFVTYNVLASNDRHEEVISFLREEDADVVFLMEVTPAWGERLRGLNESYPHQIRQERRGPFGVLLLSRFPLKEKHLRYYGVSGQPSVEAVIEWGGEDLRIVGTHPMPPYGRETSGQRNEQLKIMNDHFRRHDGESLVVAGDFNVTPFSVHYGAFLEGTELRDSALGFGVSPTWNRHFPWVAIPIDHVFVSDDVAVLDRRVGPACGSDHSPVIVTLGRVEQ
jgi:endonuclease/exonuclease/phosphatase (EEP) superfamily protein YafD